MDLQKCEYSDRIPEFVDGELDDQLSQEITDHIRKTRCRTCLVLIREIKPELVQRAADLATLKMLFPM